jgi:hypothetical protein
VHFSKFSKIHKNYTVGPIFRRGTWEHLGMTSGAPQGGTPQAGAASKGGAPPWCVGPPLPHFIIPSSHFLLSPEKTRTRFFSLVFLLKSSRFLDLFAQPRFLSEIWHICSSVCDSSNHPSRILFGGVYLEYFAAVGNMFSELACLF